MAESFEKKIGEVSQTITESESVELSDDALDGIAGGRLRSANPDSSCWDADTSVDTDSYHQPRGRKVN